MGFNRWMLVGAGTLLAGCAGIRIPGLTASQAQAQDAAVPVHKESDSGADAAFEAAVKAHSVWLVDLGFLKHEGEAPSDHLDDVIRRGRNALDGRTAAAGFIADCKAGKFANARTVSFKDDRYKASTECAAAVDAEGIVTRAVTADARANAEARLRDRDYLLKEWERNKKVKDWAPRVFPDNADLRELISVKLPGDVKPFGAAAPTDLLPRLDGFAARYQALVDASLKENKVESAKAKNPSAEKAMLDELNAYFTRPVAGADQLAAFLSPKKVMITDSDWTYRKNGLGVVLNRNKATDTLVAVKGRPYCLLVGGAVWQEATGAGQFAPNFKAEVYADPLIVPCR